MACWQAPPLPGQRRGALWEVAGRFWRGFGAGGGGGGRAASRSGRSAALSAFWRPQQRRAGATARRSRAEHRPERRIAGSSARPPRSPRGRLGVIWDEALRCVTLRACRGVLGCACCPLEPPRRACARRGGTAVGWRALASCTGGRVSGDWPARACWIPARAATARRAGLLSCWVGRRLAPAAVGFLCCLPVSKAVGRLKHVPFSALRCAPCGRGAGWTSKHPPRPAARARAGRRAVRVGPRRVLDLSDAEHGVGTMAAGLYLPRIRRAFDASCGRRPRPPWLRPPWLGSCGAGVGEECYLVDPASSHMLVSKIKPCMCKYELIQTVKLRMAH